MHAYLRSIHYRYYYTLSSSQIIAVGYDSLFNSYVDSLFARNTQAGINTFMTGNQQFDHNQMAEYLLDIMSEALEKIDNSRISNKRYYWFLNWGGLYKTKAMNMHWPNVLDTIITNRWPPTNPAPSDDSTRGLKYALTLSRLDSIYKAAVAETYGTINSLGRKKVLGGCY